MLSAGLGSCDEGGSVPPPFAQCVQAGLYAVAPNISHIGLAKHNGDLLTAPRRFMCLLHNQLVHTKQIPTAYCRCAPNVCQPACLSGAPKHNHGSLRSVVVTVLQQLQHLLPVIIGRPATWWDCGPLQLPELCIVFCFAWSTAWKLLNLCCQPWTAISATALGVLPTLHACNTLSSRSGIGVALT